LFFLSVHLVLFNQSFSQIRHFIKFLYVCIYVCVGSYLVYQSLHQYTSVCNFGTFSSHSFPSVFVLTYVVSLSISIFLSLSISIFLSLSISVSIVQIFQPIYLSRWAPHILKI
jgi:hypothetical protein